MAAEVKRPAHGAGSFDAQPHSRGRGRVAEDAAAAWLERQGYAIRERNHRTRWAELDVVAVDGDTLCFVEVKARLDDALGSPLEAVTRRKQSRIGHAAAFYLAETDWQGPCRFDVLGMTPDARGDWTYELIRDAFELPDSA